MDGDGRPGAEWIGLSAFSLSGLFYLAMGIVINAVTINTSHP